MMDLINEVRQRVEEAQQDLKYAKLYGAITVALLVYIALRVRK